MSEGTLKFKKELKADSILELLSKIPSQDLEKMKVYLAKISEEVNDREDSVYISSRINIAPFNIDVEASNSGIYDDDNLDILPCMFRVNIQCCTSDSSNNLNIMGTGKYESCTQEEYNEFMGMVDSLLNK